MPRRNPLHAVRPAASVLCAFLLGLAVCLVPVAARADPTQGARSAALGGTTLADNKDNAAIVSSPGVVALSERYDVAVQGAWAPVDQNLEGSASVLDSKEAAFTLGVAYRYRTWEAPLTDADLPGWSLVDEEVTNRKRSHDIGVALGVPLKKDVVAIGINGALAFTSHDRQDAGIYASPGVGFGWQPKKDILVALSARGLVPGKMQQEMPFVGGVGFQARADGIGSFRVEGDWQLGETVRPWSIRVGAEKEIKSGRFRLGYREDGPLGRHVLTVGAGADNDSGGLDLAVEVPFGAWSATTIRLGIRIFT